MAAEPSKKSKRKCKLKHIVRADAGIGSSRAEEVGKTVKTKKLVWNVFVVKSGEGEIKVYNVFDHLSFYEDVMKHLKKCETKEELSEALRHSMMYYFWSKYEWEVLISSLSDRDKDKALKVDAYWQVKNNWDVFVDYVWDAKARK